MHARSLFRALVALVGGVSLHASAQTCPKPTLDQCVSDAYRQGACFKVHADACTALIEEQWKLRTSKLPKARRLLPQSMGGQLADVRVAPPVQPVKSNFEGLSSDVAGLVAANQILHRKNFQNLSSSEQAHAHRLTAWAQSGPQVDSCQEYVHEKHLDFSEFEAKAGRYGADFRAYFNAAYSNEGIAYRKLYSRGGATLPPIFTGKQRVEKNAYFLFRPGPYPAGQYPYVFKTTAAKLANNPSARSFYVPSDAWHLQMSDVLTQEADDRLDELQVQQADFRALLSERATVWESYLAQEKALGNSLPNVQKQVAAQLRKLDGRIESALVAAQKAGCLDAQAPNACDWSPRRYKDMVSGVMDARRQQDLTQCLRLTANDFSAKSFVRNAHLLKLKTLPLINYTVSPEHLAEFLRRYRDFISGLDRPVDPSTGATRRSGVHADRGEFGDRGSFAAAVEYSGGWEASWGSRFCDADVSIGGHATLSGWVFGGGGEIAHLEGRVGTEASNIRLFVLARFAGSEVYRTDSTHPALLDFVVANPTFYDGTIVEGNATFTIVFVPVTVGGGVSASIGMEFRLGGQVTRNCSLDRVGLDVIGTVKPYASLSGYGSVAIGFPGLRVGVRGTLLISRVEVPLRGEVGIHMSSPYHPTAPSSLLLNLGTRLSIRQRYLDGRISLFGELGPFVGEVTLVSWPGFGGEAVLWDESFETPLARL